MELRLHNFKRVVLELHPSVPDRTMRLAVELADLLHLELLGLFLEDTSLRDLASIPFAREFRPLGGGWHPLNLDRLSHDLEVAVHSTERVFADAAKHLLTKSQFEVIRGPTAETIVSISRTGDIVMIVEPLNPAERATQQFSWLVEAAFRSVAAVMLVPTQIARTVGPVVAIATNPDDPSVRAAAAIAIAAKEDLIIVRCYEESIDDGRIDKLIADTGLTIKSFAADRLLVSDSAALFSFFHEFQERLVVLTRGILAPEIALTIALARRVPVLVIEPQATMLA